MRLLFMKRSGGVTITENHIGLPGSCPTATTLGSPCPNVAWMLSDCKISVATVLPTIGERQQLVTKNLAKSRGTLVCRGDGSRCIVFQ